MSDDAPLPPAPQPGFYGQPVVAARPCYSCGRDWGTGTACQFCRQLGGMPAGIQLSTAGKRFGGYLLEGVLAILTLVIGWLIWAAIIFSDGQTPAKKVVGMRCVNLRTNQHATWGRMFLREFIAKPVIGVLSWFTLGIVNFWLVWDSNTQELWDKMVTTVVVDDPNSVLVHRPEPEPVAAPV
jgi:uncharacterized RDD family membrane protein YckC